MKQTVIKYSSLMVFMLLFQVPCFLTGCATLKPTATVIDDETGKPIEGAVALAIWRENSTEAAAWFEGGKDIPVRIEEVLTDKEGNIFIKGFWNWHLIEREYPRLTIYKFGYVCWDQKAVFGLDGWGTRQDFNKENRKVKLVKWPVGISSEEHFKFIRDVTNGDNYKAKDQLFNNELWPKKNRNSENIR
jgi:hypothetical protein